MMRHRRRQWPETAGGAQLALMALLDVAAIILILVLRSLASMPLALPVNGIDLPRAVNAQPASDATTIAITADHLIVNDRPVARLRRGQVAADAKRDGADGFFITPLHEALLAAASGERLLAQLEPDRPFDGVALVAADRAVPFRLLSEVLYTAGQAGYGRFEFAVVTTR
ncbi:MAG: biopolymer transporter ExbD [Deltaproteobacteria bacterium]|nr:biopolymer transporter ExbD [Deltaproteobacteria bacterium]